MRIHHRDAPTHADKVVGVAEAPVEYCFEYCRLALALRKKHRHRRLQVGRESGILVRAHRDAFVRTLFVFYGDGTLPYLHTHPRAAQKHQQRIDMPRLAVSNFDVVSRKRGKNNKTAGFYPVGRRDIRQTVAMQKRAAGARESERRRTRALYMRAARV